MQPERRRFLIALSGIAGCLVIAAAILFSTPSMLVVDAPAARAASIALPSPLNQLPLPAIAFAEPARPESPGSRRRRVAVVPAAAPAAVPAAKYPMVHESVHLRIPEVALPSSTLPASAHAIPVTGLPQMTGSAMEVRHEPSDRGPVTAAFVTAGTHVGQGFRTVGRTLKNLF